MLDRVKCCADGVREKLFGTGAVIGFLLAEPVLNEDTEEDLAVDLDDTEDVDDGDGEAEAEADALAIAAATVAAATS